MSETMNALRKIIDRLANAPDLQDVCNITLFTSTISNTGYVLGIQKEFEWPFYGFAVNLETGEMFKIAGSQPTFKRNFLKPGKTMRLGKTLQANIGTEEGYRSAKWAIETRGKMFKVSATSFTCTGVND